MSPVKRKSPVRKFSNKFYVDWVYYISKKTVKEVY